MNRTKFHRMLMLLPCVAAAIAIVPPVYAQSDSPFAGVDEVPRSSETLQWTDPVYENTNVVVESSTLSSALNTGGRGATGFNQSLAREIESLLPEGISPITSGADSSFISVGVQAKARVVIPADDSIDVEQVIELTEEVDAEQTRETDGRAAPDAIGKYIVHYPVALDNIPVSKYADVTAFVNEDGGLDVLRKRNLPVSLNANSASVSGEQATATAITDAGNWAEGADISGPALEVWVNPDGEGILSYRIEITDNSSDTPQARRYWVAATGDAKVIFWESMMFHRHHGQVTGTVWTHAGTTTGPTANEELSDLTVHRSTGGLTVTDNDGRFAFTSGGGSANLTAKLSGPNSVVNNFAGGEMSRSRAATPATPADLTFNASGASLLAQTTAFYWTNKAHELASDILDDTDLPGLPTIVNRPGQCNAFWNGSSINFYVAGGNCPNMAYGSVVLHEYGHGIDARKGGIINGGYSEGFGDAVSILGTRDSCVGEDFFGAGTCLRDAADLIMWPLGSDGVHAQGRRYAGFVWELVQQLKANFPEDSAYEITRQLVMGASKANPSDIPDAVRLSFVVDDDDGDLTNGTPHFAELAAAADSRNLPRPADPTKGVRRMGFAWANNPRANSYTPSVTYTHNSAGMPVKATRSGVGRYAITFAGLGGQGRAGANVQVTAYGSSPNQCKVRSWSSGGKDFRANVNCFSPNGSAVDERYSVLITWP